MNKHIIYIPNLGQEYLLSQQLAHAFAKYYCDELHDNSPTIVAQYGSNLKPLELVTPKDTLQIMFTPVANLYAPIHTQTNEDKLLKEIPTLINHLIQDGLNVNGITIQLYTLEHEHNNQNISLIKSIAKELLAKTNFINFSIEWHVIPKLNNLTNEQLQKIFKPNLTCQAIIHAITEDGLTKLIESSGIYIRSDNVH